MANFTDLSDLSEQQEPLETLGGGAELRDDKQTLFWPADYIDEEDGQARVVSPELHITETTTPEEVLRYYWGYEDFRELQGDIIRATLSGVDVLGLMPTGGGKSITFQVPGLMLEGLTLVVTPLISLMKDQVAHLRARGIKATAIHSGMYAAQIGIALDNCVYGRYKFLYISPERLASAAFRERLPELGVSLLVIDECHCISQWGYDFRPSYLNIVDIRNLLSGVPVLALTATATPDVAEDIQCVLGFGKDSRVFVKSFYRPNLSYSIRSTDNKAEKMLQILERVPGSAIVYCRSREQTKVFSDYLNGQGVSASYFHAGLTHLDRDLRQERWMRGEVRVMVATNAFGMGIDKPDVRLVIHVTMPSSLEEYFQEAGRAGRDSERAYAVALLGDTDLRVLRRRLIDSFPERDYIYKTYESLCNYLQIGEGEGFQRTYACDLEQFIRRFRMRPVQTISALEILEVSGFLAIHRDETRSRLQIVYTREQLYAEGLPGEIVLRTMMRLYTGLFADYVFIVEQDIAQQCDLRVEEVYEVLKELSRLGVVHYIPQSKLPRITMLIRREDVRHLHIPRKAYEDRQERMRHRIEAVCDYLERDDRCRSQILLSYFGEESSESCRRCDVCLSTSPVGLKQYVIRDTARVVSGLLGEREQVLMCEVAEELSFALSDIVEAVRYLALSEERFLLEGDLLRRL